MRSPSPIEPTLRNGSTDQSVQPTAPLPFDAPQYVLDNVIYVTDPEDILAEVSKTRSKRLEVIFQRYKSQIQLGCKNPECTVPTCLSCRKRSSKAPVRVYTAVSARTLAYALISERDPEAGICWNEPIFSGKIHGDRDSGLPSQRRSGSFLKTERVIQEQHIADGEIINRHSKPKRTSPFPSRQRKQSAGSLRSGSHPPSTEEELGDSIRHVPSSEVNSSSAPPSDPKSYTQSLFGSLALSSLPERLSLLRTDGEGELEEEMIPAEHAIEDGQHKYGAIAEPCPSNLVPTLDVLTYRTALWLETMSRAITVTENAQNASAAGKDIVEIPSIKNFVEQSLFYCLKTPRLLLRSLMEWHSCENFGNEALQSFRLRELRTSEFIKTLCGIRPIVIVLRHLLEAARQAYTSPPWVQALQQRRKLHQAGSLKTEVNDGTYRAEHSRAPVHLDDMTAAFICAVCLYALNFPFWLSASSGVLDGNPPIFAECSPLPNPAQWNLARFHMQKSSIPTYGRSLPSTFGTSDFWGDADACHLFETVMQLISTRLSFQQMASVRGSGSNGNISRRRKKIDFNDLIIRHLEPPGNGNGELFPNVVAYLTIDWCRHLLHDSWNGTPVLQRATPAGGCLSFLARMFKHRQSLELDIESFYMDIWLTKFDTLEMPVEWLEFRASNKEVHLLSYSFLFRPAILMSYFRAINFSTMTKSFESAGDFEKHTRRWTSENSSIPVLFRPSEIASTVGPQSVHSLQFLVLRVRRKKILKDAFNQIWRLQRRELMRPLKVELGEDEGEEGVDAGGVQQEFFGVLLAEALDPVFGMFTIDETTQMAWFQPGSLEPLYKFELLGILMSIAVYNSITLPITFPLAFYRKLLGLKVKKLCHIIDGWPEVTKGMQEMLDWSGGDVGDVFMRTYVFSYEAFGVHHHIEMEKIGRDDRWPPAERKKGKEKAKSASFEFPPSPHLTPPDDRSPALSPVQDLSLGITPKVDNRGTLTPASAKSDTIESEPSLVTNANREDYVKDHIFWLTDKSIRPQFEAFARGFYTCLDRTALSIFTAEALKTVIEGHQEIDLDQWQKATTYSGYRWDSGVISAFWKVVESFDAEKRKQLLLFVTASDRVPVSGIGSIKFDIQKNGLPTHLPTSSTCFGKLLLPDYPTREILEEKLTKAISNTRGFGNQ